MITLRAEVSLLHGFQRRTNEVVGVACHNHTLRAEVSLLHRASCQHLIYKQLASLVTLIPCHNHTLRAQVSLLHGFQHYISRSMASLVSDHSSCITSYVMRTCGNLWHLLKTLMQFKSTDLKQHYVTMILLSHFLDTKREGLRLGQGRGMSSTWVDENVYAIYKLLQRLKKC